MKSHLLTIFALALLPLTILASSQLDIPDSIAEIEKCDQLQEKLDYVYDAAQENVEHTKQTNRAANSLLLIQSQMRIIADSDPQMSLIVDTFNNDMLTAIAEKSDKHSRIFHKLANEHDKLHEVWSSKCLRETL
jgi:hypothetical protein